MTVIRPAPIAVPPAPLRPASLAAALAAAQADAERLYGGGPVPSWTPPPTRKVWVAGGVAAALLAVGVWWWTAAGDAPVGMPATVIATAPIAARDAAAAPEAREAAPPAEVTTAEATAAPAVADGPACDTSGCRSQPELPPAPALPPSPPADPDAWALHPEPGPVEALPRFEAAGNTPEIPDENDATPGEETGPDEDPGAGALVEQD